MNELEGLKRGQEKVTEAKKSNVQIKLEQNKRCTLLEQNRQSSSETLKEAFGVDDEKSEGTNDGEDETGLKNEDKNTTCPKKKDNEQRRRIKIY